ncbi:dTDP-4-dehydrorhamnose reductase [Sulfitobacter sp. KE34]|uniref:dTDP-4-dehydrorhamnose reductase n=1 Tax=unclassified Sulfitobacter TaxID=196795 RepID=UPI0023E30433|nr:MULTISPECIES: dTDP-4-dehydrorhamnose reductase [unclassified Sulfitobacter]MDF3352168.1 dTDP-4-dehydrorhamnose reductase [Sulfitobacter sp. KE12]MDF3355804.1 dTDP-4-dehydrorhamnose reductase [Sulfitobacter sp. KE27]MDF3359236.1 dTDP-4-dehydrorhamnose reductase [Sulfitobacter sp. KE33]MDF3366700.1 dTDP-4-dehydrorhamnose reductase [Sulfitobacter sp. Ks34]MDF3370493.1 dTDP-4-dehydrorhamnose reductase [Sulfitobacter sp. Ks43]
MILVFGKTGQVATELQAHAPEAQFLSRTEADLSDPAACAAAIKALKPTAVINAAAYTAVDAAETEERLAQVINGNAPGAMAQACADLGIPLVHLSTDYVFDGAGQVPWKPGDPTVPLGVYGRTKLAGEEAIRAIGCRHVILRTSWVFSAHGSNFVKTMLRLSGSRNALSIVDDQIGGPTPAAAIAKSCLRIVEALQGGQRGGTYHYAGSPAVSWKGFARETFAAAQRDVVVRGIPTSEYPTAARRPLNSRLDCTSLQADFGIGMPEWKPALTEVVKKLIA